MYEMWGISQNVKKTYMPENPLEQSINTLIRSVETQLLKGQVHTTNPHSTLETLEQLGGYLSTVKGLEERLDTLEAQFHVNRKLENGDLTSLAIGKQWKITEEGIRQAFWQNRESRLKVLIDTLERSYYSSKYEYEKSNPKGI